MITKSPSLSYFGETIEPTIDREDIEAPSPRKRWGLFATTIIPFVIFMGLLGWALIFAEESPGGLSPNNEPREAQVETRFAPIFSLQSLDEKGLIYTNRFKGQVVMIDFWSSWCPPCRAEAAGLQEVYDEYLDRPVEFIGIAIWDHDDDVRAHISEFDITYPNAIDDSGKTAIAYGVLGIPEKFFLDPNGNIIRKFVGPIDPETLRSILDEILDGG